MKIDPKTYAVSQQDLAPMLGITTRRIRQIVADGWFSANEDGKYVLRDALAGYEAMIKTARDRRHNPATERLQIAKAEQIEARIAAFDRDHIMTDEAISFLQELGAAYADSIRRLPRLITKDPRERIRIEAICEGDALRIEKNTKAAAVALKTGRTETDEEED